MARTLQAAALPQIEGRQLPAAATLAALGIVYGDIGTSPLYGFKQAADASGAITPETIIGITSVILWSLIVIVSFKYAILIMRADNRGEGGIIALLALLDVRCAPAGSWRASLLIVGLLRTAEDRRAVVGVRTAAWAVAADCRQQHLSWAGRVHPRHEDFCGIGASAPRPTFLTRLLTGS
jgi:hypothetical protein